MNKMICCKCNRNTITNIPDYLVGVIPTVCQSCQQAAESTEIRERSTKETALKVNNRRSSQLGAINGHESLRLKKLAAMSRQTELVLVSDGKPVEVR